MFLGEEACRMSSQCGKEQYEALPCVNSAQPAKRGSPNLIITMLQQYPPVQEGSTCADVEEALSKELEKDKQKGILFWHCLRRPLFNADSTSC